MPAKRVNPAPHGDARRDALLAALEELLEEKPVQDVGIGEISAKAGVTRSSFYFYFPTKAAAVAALLSDLSDELLAGTWDWLERDDLPPRERVLTGIEHVTGLWRRHARLFVAMVDSVSTDEVAAQAWNEFIDRVVSVGAARLREERKKGLAPDGPNATELLRNLIAMNFQAYDRDARSLIATGRGTRNLAPTLAEIWVRAMYGNP